MLVEAALSDDPQVLRAMLVERDRQITASALALALAEAELARLGVIIAAFQRHRFEARSEQLDPDQLRTRPLKAAAPPTSAGDGAR